MSNSQAYVDHNGDGPCRRCSRCKDCHFCNDCRPCTGDMDPAYQAGMQLLREKEDEDFRARQELEAQSYGWG